VNPDDLSRILDELGRRLGPAGSHVFELAVRQAIVSSLIWGLLALVITIVCILGISRLVRGWSDQSDDGEFFSLMLIVGQMFVLVLSVGVTAASLVTLLNPEYSGLRDILSAIRGH
jgi:ABC-type Fe3+ transport system permease subunit